MPRNEKLTKVIVGRTVKVATVEPGAVLVVFDDGSNMKIKTAGPATISAGGKVKSVHETKAEFKIDFEDGWTRHSAWPIRARLLPSEIKTMQWNTSDKFLNRHIN